MTKIIQTGDKSKRLEIAKATLKKAEIMAKVNLPQKVKNELWGLILSIDPSGKISPELISISEHEITGESLVLWLESTYSPSIEDCVIIEVPLKQFGQIILEEDLNQYGSDDPILWYDEEATRVQRKWAREAVLKTILKGLVESEVSHG